MHVAPGMEESCLARSCCHNCFCSSMIARFTEEKLWTCLAFQCTCQVQLPVSTEGCIETLIVLETYIWVLQDLWISKLTGWQWGLYLACCIDVISNEGYFSSSSLNITPKDILGECACSISDSPVRFKSHLWITLVFTSLTLINYRPPSAQQAQFESTGGAICFNYFPQSSVPTRVDLSYQSWYGGLRVIYCTIMLSHAIDPYYHFNLNLVQYLDRWRLA